MKGYRLIFRSLSLLLCAGFLCVPLTSCVGEGTGLRIGDCLADLPLTDAENNAVLVGDLSEKGKILILFPSSEEVKDSHLRAAERIIALYGSDWTVCLLWKEPPSHDVLGPILAANSYQADITGDKTPQICVTDKNNTVTSLPAAGFADLAKEMVAATEDKDALLTDVVDAMRDELMASGVLPQESDKPILMISYMPTCRKCMPTVREIYKKADVLMEQYHLVSVLTAEDPDHPVFSENALIDTFAVYLRALQRDDNIALICLEGETVMWLTPDDLPRAS